MHMKYLGLQIATILLVGLGVAMLAIAAEDTDSPACKSICASDKDQCVKNIPMFTNTLRDPFLYPPSKNSQDVNSFLQNRDDNKTTDASYARELRQKCDATFVQCKMSCQQQVQ